MKKLILMLLISMCISAQAQHIIRNTFQTPDVASLMTEVRTPVALSSGGLSIEIPLYTLKEGDITVPISLSYDATGIRVASHPGWVGQNWTLKAGGMISRVVKGIPDETCVYIDECLSGFGGDNYQRTNHFWGYYYNYNRLNTSSWNTTSQIMDWARDNYDYELEPDEYIFNFCGHAGRFYMDQQGRFKVIGQEGYKIEPLALYGIPLYDGRSSLLNETKGSVGIDDGSYTYQNGNDRRYVRLHECRVVGFKVIDPEGYVYYFGSYEKAAAGDINIYEDNMDGIEISSSFFSQLYDESYSTWYLVKIESPKHFKVEFNYENGRVATFSTSYTMNDMKVKDQASFWNMWSPGYLRIYSEGQSMDGSLLRNLYLKSITTGNTVVQFDRSPANALDYDYSMVQMYLDNAAREYYNPAVQTLYWYGICPIAVPKIVVNYNNQKVIGKTFDPSLLEWEKLDAMSVSWKDDHSAPLKYVFTYRENATDRLQLTSVQKMRDTLKEPPYRFYYNNEKKLPGYLDLRTDHWGYYNGIVPSVADKANFGNYKVPDPDYTDSEILTGILYPTKGFRAFTYEPNTYTKVVRRDRSSGKISVVPVSESIGGGLRIKEITDRPIVGKTPDIHKTYTYAGGILNGESQYYWPDYVGRLTNGNTYTASRFFSYSILPVSENASGGAISYSRVTEAIDGNGCIVYTYSNHDTHPDETAVSIDPQKSAYSPLTSNVAQRGLLMKKEVFAENNPNPLETIVYSYTAKNSNAYIPSVNIRRYTYFDGTSTNAVEGSAYKIYTSPILLQSQTERLYADNSSLPFITSKSYTYNSLNQVKEESTLRSEQAHTASARYEIVRRSYLSDAVVADPANPVYKEMTSRNMLAPLVAETTFVEGKKIKEVRNHYAWNNEIAYVDTIRVANRDGIFRTESVCRKTDSRGNPVEIWQKGINTVCLWGYNYQYPVAIFRNATYQEVADSLGITSPEEWAAPLRLDGSVMIGDLKWKVPQAQVTAYSYIPLVGISTEVSPEGIAIYYKYDLLGRLIEVRDIKRRTVKRYTYRYFE